MTIRSTRDALRRLFYQRCFHLFVLLLALIAVAPIINTSPGGAFINNVINAFIIVSAVAAVGRTKLSFVFVAITRPARTACTIEMIIGQLFIAILIARLVGVYPPRGRAG